MLQLQVLKVIKSQVPFCGRKWRQCRAKQIIADHFTETSLTANMKTITAIYLNCKPELRDEWLAAIDIDNEVEESNVGGRHCETRILSLPLCDSMTGGRECPSDTHQVLP